MLRKDCWKSIKVQLLFKGNFDQIKVICFVQRDNTLFIALLVVVFTKVLH